LNKILKKWSVYPTALCLLLMTSVMSAAGSFSDIKTHWARNSIETLSTSGVIGGYPDQTFRPDQPITRGEFAKMLSVAFPVPTTTTTAFADTAHHWAKDAIHSLAATGIIEGFPDNTFRPDENITRAAGAQLLVRSLGLGDLDNFSMGIPSTFSDITSAHWAYNAINTLNYLRIFPPYVQDICEPDAYLTRAEAAWMVYQAIRISQDKGSVTFFDPETGLLTLRTADDRIRDFRTTENTFIQRNGKVIDFKALKVGDEVRIVADRFGNPRILLSTGSEPYNDLVRQAAEIIREIVTPQDLNKIAKGDWSSVLNNAKENLYNRLIASGVTIQEADALFTQNWGQLKGALSGRLAEVIAERFNISQELATSLINQNWDQAKQEAQYELAEILLNHLLQALDTISPTESANNG
jgi:hypothetical protein